MRYLSVCSGIEAATVAWHPLGWTPAAFAEVEAFPSAVLKHHYPETRNLGDITNFRDWPDAAVDVLVGGTPCQSFSVAGLRQGLADPRGNLALVYLAIADRYRPRWCLWENVPGVLSSEGGRDFGAFLGGLAELGYGWAYRVIDAQHCRVDGFGRAVPQRRRRVFVVGHLGGWARAAAVLFDAASLSGNPPPRRQPGQGVAPSLTVGAHGSSGHQYRQKGNEDALIASEVAPTLRAGGNATGSDRPYGTDADTADSLVVAGTLGVRSADHASGLKAEADFLVAHALTADGFDAGEDGTGRGTPLVAVSLRNGQIDGDVAMTLQGGGTARERGMSINCIPHVVGGHGDIAGTVSAKWSKGSGGPAGDEVQNLIAFDARQSDAVVYGDRAGPLDTDGHSQAVAFQTRFARNGRGAPEEVASALTAHAGRTGKGDSSQIVAFAENIRSELREMEVTDALNAGGGKPGQGYPAIRHGWAVRRLTPTECERLQGFPDGYTAVPFRGKPAADGPRYKALGNSFAVNVVRWIGTRIAMVEAVPHD